MSYLVDRDIYNSSGPTCIDKCCNGFRAGKQLTASYGLWFIVSYDSANKQKHHKSHRMQ